MIEKFLGIDDLGIVIVVFHLLPAQVAAQAAERAPGVYTILVDNTPGRVQSDFGGAIGIEYLALGKNLGIAAALNAGIAKALAAGKTLITTFDQDSRFDSNLLASLAADYRLLRQCHGGPLAVGPLPFNKDSGVSYLRRLDRIRRRLIWRRRTGLLEVGEVITSGLTADVTTYRQVGGYLESLFIDFVDHEWCWRLRAANGRCFVSLRSRLPHKVGDGDVRYTFGMKRGAAHRLFYLFRNATYLAASGTMPLFDSIKFVCLVPLKLVVFGIFFADRFERVGNALHGLRSGIRWALGRANGGAAP